MRIGCFSLFFATLLLGCDSRAPDHLVFISLDTVRRDHLPTYGYTRQTAPRIEAFAQRSFVFSNAFSQQTNTTPSHASMFTGLYPHVHGSRSNEQRLPSGRTTLAEVLAREGFRTSAFVSGATMRAVASGLDQGFEVYDDDFPGVRRNGQVAATRSVEWIRTRAPGERYFLFLHLYDAHGPYLARRRYRQLYRSPDPGPHLTRIPRYQQLRDGAGRPFLRLGAYVNRYDALIRYQDDLVGALLDEVDLGRTAVVILSDHGETLGERYQALDHGAQVFDEQIRIPLIVHVPGLSPRRIGDKVETVDLTPTLLEILDVPIPKGFPCQGRDLMPLMRGEEIEDRPVVFASARSVSARHADRGYHLQPRSDIHTVRGLRWKLIFYPGLEQDYVELYDLDQDPAERENRADAEPDVRDAYLRTLERWLGNRTSPTDETPLPPEVLEQLRQLGYVEP